VLNCIEDLKARVAKHWPSRSIGRSQRLACADGVRVRRTWATGRWLAAWGPVRSHQRNDHRVRERVERSGDLTIAGGSRTRRPKAMGSTTCCWSRSRGCTTSPSDASSSAPSRAIWRQATPGPLEMLRHVRARWARRRLRASRHAQIRMARQFTARLRGLLVPW